MTSFLLLLCILFILRLLLQTYFLINNFNLHLKTLLFLALQGKFWYDIYWIYFNSNKYFSRTKSSESNIYDELFTKILSQFKGLLYIIIILHFKLNKLFIVLFWYHLWLFLLAKVWFAASKQFTFLKV